MTSGLDPLAVATEVRLGRMGRENAKTKALRYLTEGRVQIRAATNRAVRAEVRGSGHLYQVSFDSRQGWACSCPAKGLCSHLIATQTVVVVDAVGGS